MSSHLNFPARNPTDSDFLELVCRYLDDQLTQDELAQINEQLRQSEAHRETFVRYCLQGKFLAESLIATDCQFGDAARNSSETSLLAETSILAPACPLPASILSSAARCLSSGWPMAYLVAMVMTIAGLWGLAHTYTSNPTQVVTALPVDAKQPSDSLPTAHSPFPSSVVGRVTGMVDCKWRDPRTTTSPDAMVCLGQKYAMASGLLEITYNTGAKVLLQGAVTYEVESTNGGYLPIGKLTGKVECDSAKGFAIRTPTAMVTDLGTEFGVTVSANQSSTVRVYKGVVEVKSSGPQTAKPHQAAITRRLAAGQAIRLESAGIAEYVSTKTRDATFVCSLPEPHAASGLCRNLVAYWSFDDATLLGKNDLGGGNLTPTRGSDVKALPPAFEPAGVLGGAVRLYGDFDKSTLLYNNGSGVPSGIPTGNSSYTISAWFRVNSQHKSSTKLGILGWGEWETKRAVVLVLGRDSQNDFVETYWVNNNSQDVTARVQQGSLQNGWHQIITTYDAKRGVTQSFVDGVRQAMANTTGHPNFGSNNFAIGRGWFNDVDQEFFDGWLDEIGIWNRGLSNDEVQQLHNHGKGLNPLTATKH